MNENYPSANVEALSNREHSLKQQVFQRVTLEYREALRLERDNSGYLQGYKILETPEPTVAFRMDSKDKVITEDNAIGLEKKLKSHSIFVFVPEKSNPERWIDRFWVKHVTPKGIEAMFELNENRVGVYERINSDRDQEIDQVYDDTLLETQELNVEEITLQAIKQKQVVIKGLTSLLEALRTDCVHVPFKS